MFLPNNVLYYFTVTVYILFRFLSKYIICIQKQCVHYFLAHCKQQAFRYISPELLWFPINLQAEVLLTKATILSTPGQI